MFHNHQSMRMSELVEAQNNQCTHYNPPEVEEVEAVVEEVEAEVAEVEVVAEDYLGRTDRKQLSIHTQGNNSTTLEAVEEEVADIQDSH